MDDCKLPGECFGCGKTFKGEKGVKIHMK